MGKHVKKKNAPTLRPEREKRDPYEDWIDAAVREGMIEDPFAEEDLLPEEASAAPAQDPAVSEEEPAAPAQDTAVSEEDPIPVQADPNDAPTEFLPPEKSILKEPAPRKKSGGKKPAPGKGRPKGKKRKRKKKNAFRKGLRTYVIIMLALILAILAALWVFLTRYQARRDAEAAEEARIEAEQAEEKAHQAAVRRAPQDAFDAWRATLTADTLTDLWFAENPGDVLESREQIRSFMEQHLSAAANYRATEYTSAAPVYVVRDGDTTLVKVTLSGADTSWSVSGVDLMLEGRESASVRAFTGGKVFCNGVELGSEYAGEVESKFDFEALADQLVNPVGWITYSVDGLLMKPELTAEPPAGANVTQTEDGDFVLCLDDAAARPYIERSINFLRAYQFYYMSGYNNTWGNLYAALAYLIPGTSAYQTLFDTKIGVEWNTAYGDIDTSNTTADSVVIWADNCYTVDVTYAPTGLLNGQRVNYDGAGTMRVYYLKGGDGNFYISHFQPLY